MILWWLAAILISLRGTLGQFVEFAAPAAGQSAILSDGKLSVRWSGELETLAGYHLLLMAGGDAESNSGQVAAVAGSKPLSSGESAVSMPVSPKAGPAAVNAFYLKMVATRNDGGSAVFYSSRFSIAGMTGGFPTSTLGQSAEEVQAAYHIVKNDVAAVPESQVVLQARQVGPNGEVPPYSAQTTGNIKYAPMQQQPPTSITAANTEPLYPTSGYNIAQSALPLPTFISTVTQPVTYKTSSIVNPATAAPPPQDDMAKFLARWKD